MDEAGRRDHGGDLARENAGRTRFQDLDAHGRESQENTGVDFDIALVPDKNLLHNLQSSATVATNERTQILALLRFCEVRRSHPPSIILKNIIVVNH